MTIQPSPAESSVPTEERRTGLGPLVVALVLTVIAAGMLVLALDFGTEARRLPMVVGVPLFVLTVMNLGVETLHAVRARRGVPAETSVSSSGPGFAEKLVELQGQSEASDDLATDDPISEVSAPIPTDGEGGIPLWGAMLVLAVLIVLYLALGQFLVAPVFVVIVMRFVGKQPWKSVVIATIFLTVVMYLLVEVMNVQAHGGWFVDSISWLG